jgi:hypothetical protein
LGADALRIGSVWMQWCMNLKNRARQHQRHNPVTTEGTTELTCEQVEDADSEVGDSEV